MPFGLGNRSCIGDQFGWAEMIVFLACTMSDWTLKPDPARVTRPVVRTLLAAGQVTVTLERRAAADQPSTTCSVRARRGAR